MGAVTAPWGFDRDLVPLSATQNRKPPGRGIEKRSLRPLERPRSDDRHLGGIYPYGALKKTLLGRFMSFSNLGESYDQRS